MKTFIIAVALGAFLLGSAAVLAQTGKETSKNWLDVMRDHYNEVHGDDFDQHHKDVHGEGWEEHVNACHGATTSAGYPGYGNMMGYGMM